MDFFQSHQTVLSRCYLTFFHERSIALVKRLAGSPKGWNWSQPYANKVLLQGSTRILIYIDGLLSVAPNCAQPLLSYLLPYSRTFNCSKTTGWFTKEAEIDPTCPTLTKCYSRCTHSYIHWWTSFSRIVPKPLLSYLLPFPERSIALVKRLAGSPRAEIDQVPHANKVLLKVALMDFFQSHQTVPNRCYLTFFHFPERSTLVRLAGSKGLKLIPTCPTLTKCYSR
jgi:hypothetical protein